MKFTYGFQNKVIKGKEYTYFWKYNGQGHKTEKYLGRAGTLKTQRKALTTKLKYLEGLQQELGETIRKTNEELAALPAEEVKT